MSLSIDSEVLIEGFHGVDLDVIRAEAVIKPCLICFLFACCCSKGAIDFVIAVCDFKDMLDVLFSEGSAL